MQKVTTWQDDRGHSIDICRECEARLTAARKWPKNSVGREYAKVHRGLHDGHCDMHPPRETQIDRQVV